MNFRQLEIFRAVVVTGSASRASEILDITQPAVSRAIADLERQLGFSIFDRVRGRLVITPEGEMLFKEVVEGFEAFDRVRAAAVRIRDFGSGLINVASLSALGSTLVPRAISIFNKQNPKIAVSLQILASHAVRDLVADGQFDIGLVADEVELTGVEHQVFGSFRAVCALPHGHDLCVESIIQPKHLHKMPFIALSPGDRARNQIADIFDDHGVQPTIVVETPNSSTACSLVMEGVGIGIVNPMAVDGYAERGVEFRPFSHDVQFKSYLLYRPDAQKSQNVKNMVSALLQARTVPPTRAQSLRNLVPEKNALG
jgi:DNA-binding transcriptional LysR family regulator